MNININNLPILLEIALKDNYACQIICKASKPFHEKVYTDNNGDSYYNILFEMHGKHSWLHNVCKRNLRALKWLHNNRYKITYCFDDPWLLQQAAFRGYVEIVQWLHDNCTNNCEHCTTTAMNFAASYGNLNVVIWLHYNCKVGCTSYAMDLAARNGHLHVIEWLHNNRTEGCTYVAMDWAAENGHLHVVKWLYQNRTEGYKDAIELAAYHKHTIIVNFLRSI